MDAFDLCELARKGDTQQLVVRISEDNRLIRIKDYNGRTVLHWAASGGHKDLVQRLLEFPGVEVNDRDDCKWTPLVIAASAGHEAVVRLLIGAGADVNSCTEQGRSALLYAASRNRIEIVKILLNEGADVNLQDKLGCGPLHRACGPGHVQVVGTLISSANHLEVNARDNWGNTPLHLACEEGQVKIVKMLGDAGANASLQNKDEKTPFQVGKPEVLKVIRDLVNCN